MANLTNNLYILRFKFEKKKMSHKDVKTPPGSLLEANLEILPKNSKPIYFFSVNSIQNSKQISKGFSIPTYYINVRATYLQPLGNVFLDDTRRGLEWTEVNDELVSAKALTAPVEHAVVPVELGRHVVGIEDSHLVIVKTIEKK